MSATKTVHIDGRAHRVSHIAPRVAQILAEHDEPCAITDALWAAHLATVARSEWGPRGYVRSARLDASTPDGSVKVYEIEACKASRYGINRVNIWATRRHAELVIAAQVMGVAL